MEKKPFKLIAKNPISRHRFTITDTIEAGISLLGTEVKSIRNTSPNLRDSFVEIKSNAKGGFEAFLLNAHISHYKYGNINNHDPKRIRKLLLNKLELKKLFGMVNKKALVIVPTKMYFVKSKIKVELGIGKGKKVHDKRDKLKKETAKRDMERAIKKFN